MWITWSVEVLHFKLYWLDIEWNVVLRTLVELFKLELLKTTNLKLSLMATNIYAGYIWGVKMALNREEVTIEDRDWPVFLPKIHG